MPSSTSCSTTWTCILYERDGAAGRENRWRAAKAGVTIPFADLLIGATALEVGYSLLTLNVRHFQLIPGLSVMQIKARASSPKTVASPRSRNYNP